jgi:hypothetical protein
MALDTTALLIPGTGAVLTGTVGATKPTLTQITAFATAGTAITGLTVLGASSADDLPAPGRDGGDTTSKYIWNQADPVRTTQEQTTDYWDVPIVQLDNGVMSLYHGGGTFSTANEFAGPAAPAAQERAVLFLMNDGGNAIGQWNPRMSIIGVDEIELDREEFTVVPLRFTRLAPVSGAPFFWIGAKFGTP